MGAPNKRYEPIGAHSISVMGNLISVMGERSPEGVPKWSPTGLVTQMVEAHLISVMGALNKRYGPVAPHLISVMTLNGALN